MGSSIFRRLGPAGGYAPKAVCLWLGEYGLDGWKEDCVGLAELGGVG
jgi:hypothetical protein